MTEFLNALYKGDMSRDMRERSEARRAAAPEVAPALAGDQAALSRLATANPDMAMKIATMLQSADARTQAQAKTRMEMAGRLAAGVLSAPPAQQPAAYMAALEQARAAGLDTSKYPQAWDGAAKAWLEHAARTLGTTSQLFKRMSVGQGGGAAVPARGGFGGPPMPAAGGPRVSAAPVPDGPMVADAGASLPPPAATPAAPPMPQIAAAPPPGAGAMPGDIPPPPQIAPPTQTADGGPVTQRFNPGSPAMLGRDEVPAPSRPDVVFAADPKIAQDFGLAPGETYGTKKNGDIVVEGDRVMVRTRDRGDVMRLIPKAQPTAGPPKPADARRDPDAAWSIHQQVPPGWAMGKGPDGLPAIDKNGRYLIMEMGADGKPTGVFDAIAPAKPEPKAPAGMVPVVGPDGTTRYESTKIRPLDSSGRKDLKSVADPAIAMRRLAGAFKDDFADYRSGWIGDMDNLRLRNQPGGDKSGQAQFWQDYNAAANVIRNELFGSALTATEKAAFEAAMINPGMAKEEIKKNLARQRHIMLRAVARRAGSMIESGFNPRAVEKELGIKLGDLPDPFQELDENVPAPGSATVQMPGGAPAEKPPEIPQGRADDLRKRYGLD